jgi:hypothetical protein
VSSREYPLLDNMYESSEETKVGFKSIRNSIFMLDMNRLKQSEPYMMRLVDLNNTNLEMEYFNLFAISLYESSNRQFKFYALNYLTKNLKRKYKYNENDNFRIEKFAYDRINHRLVHTQTYSRGLETGLICDLTVVDDQLIYFTKCFADANYKSLKLSMQIRSGEIWVINLREKIVYPVVKNLFMPKSIQYLKSKEMMFVTNLDCDGLSIYKREFDNSLTKFQELRLNTFVFNINLDVQLDRLYVTSHPILYETLKIRDHSTYSSSQLVQIMLNFKYSHRVECEQTVLFSTNGSLLNGLSAGIFYRNNFVLFSLLNDPKVCL